MKGSNALVGYLIYITTTILDILVTEKKKIEIPTTAKALKKKIYLHIRVLVEGLVRKGKRKSQLIGRDSLGETTTGDDRSSGNSSATDNRTGQERHLVSDIKLNNKC